MATSGTATHDGRDVLACAARDARPRSLPALPETLARRLVEVPLPPPLPGVYLLLAGEEVVYVGQSAFVEQRVAHHWQVMPRGSFDRALVLAVPREDLDAFEGALIRALRPKFNKRGPRPSAREMSILIDLGLPLHQPHVARREILVANYKPPAPGDGRRGRGRRRTRRSP